MEVKNTVPKKLGGGDCALHSKVHKEVSELPIGLFLHILAHLGTAQISGGCI